MILVPSAASSLIVKLPECLFQALLPLEVLQPARRGLGARGLVVEDGVAVGGLAAAVPEDGALEHRQPRHIVHHH